MGLFVRQDEKRSELQNRIASELWAKSKQASDINSKPDGVDDSVYIKGTKTTTSLAWIWVFIVLVGVGVALWLASLAMAYN